MKSTLIKYHYNDKALYINTKQHTRVKSGRASKKVAMVIFQADSATLKNP